MGRHRRKNRLRLLFTTGAAFLMAAVLAACGGGGQGGETAADGGTNAAEPVEAGFTMAEIVAANRSDTLLEKYGSLLVQHENLTGEEDLIVTEYSDSELVYLDFASGAEIYYHDGTSGYAYYASDGGIYGGMLIFDYDDSRYDYLSVDPTLTAKEEIVSVEEGEGTLTLHTRFSASLFRPYYPEGEFPFENTDVVEETYLLNAEDYAIIENTGVLARADGSTQTLDALTVTYGADRPEMAQTLDSRRKGEDMRTGTIVLDPGTPQERSASAEALKGDFISTYLPEGYTVYYKDPACTEVSTEEEEKDFNADFIYYSIPD